MRNGRPSKALEVARTDLQILNQLILTPEVEPGMRLRCSIVLLSAAGLLNKAIAERLGISNATVGKWRNRYIESGLDGLLGNAAWGGGSRIPRESLERIVHEAIHTKQCLRERIENQVADTEIKASSMVRIWDQLGIAPHRWCGNGRQDPFDGWAKAFPVGLQIDRTICAALILSWKFSSFDSCEMRAHAGHGPDRCLGEALQLQFTRSIQALAHGITLKGLDQNNLAAFRRFVELQPGRCPQAALHVFYHSTHSPTVTELLEWKRDCWPTARMYFSFEFADWLGVLHRFGRFLENLPDFSNNTRVRASLTHLFDVEVAKARSDHNRNMYWFMQPC